jgi:hypothetical protein
MSQAGEVPMSQDRAGFADGVDMGVLRRGEFSMGNGGVDEEEFRG